MQDTPARPLTASAAVSGKAGPWGRVRRPFGTSGIALGRLLRVTVLAGALTVVLAALLTGAMAPAARAEVSDQDLDVCIAYAQIELASQYGSPSSLSFINDERATMERYDGVVDGHYVSTILRMDGVLTTPDGVARPVRITCLLASVGEPVGLRLEPRR